MSVSTTTNRVQYAGNNSTVTSYPIPFYFQDEEWINVQIVNAAGYTTTLALGDDYAITGAGDPEGGELTTVLAYPNTSNLTIFRAVPITQLIDLVYNDRLPAAQIELALDKLTFIAQQLASFAASGERALTFPVTEPDSNTNTLPTAAARLGKFLYFNETTGEMELVSINGDGNVVIGDGTTIDILASIVGVINNGITNAKLAQVATSTIKGRRTAGTGNVEDITFANLLTDLVSLGSLSKTPLLVTGNITATFGRTHHVTASATFTDPTGVEGASYIVKVLNGTATVGATAYNTYGTIIERSYYSGAWQTNRVYLNKAQLDTTYATFAQGAKADTASQQTTLAAVPTTSGTAFDFSSIPNSVKEITIGFNGVSLTAADDVLIQIGATTPTTSGYLSSCGDRGTDSDSTAGFVVFLSNSAFALHGHATLKKLDGFWTMDVSAARSGGNPIAGGGNITFGAVDMVRITRTGSSTFDAGSISISYKR